MKYHRPEVFSDTYLSRYLSDIFHDTSICRKYHGNRVTKYSVERGREKMRLNREMKMALLCCSANNGTREADGCKE